MKRYVLNRMSLSVLMTAVSFPVLLAATPVPEQGEAAVMALALALLAGGMLYCIAGHVKTPAILVLLMIGLLAGMILRTLSLTQSGNSDYLSCLKPWAQDFRDNGWKAVVHTRSDYNMPYLYIIGFIARIPMNDLYLYKLVSIVFDCGIVIAGLRLARIFSLGELRKTVLCAALFLAPTVWLNSSFWAQCDAVYAFFCLLALGLALEKRPSLSAAMAAVAFSFKLQTIFFLPVFIVFWMVKRVRWWREIPVFLGTFIALFCPAWILGRPFGDIVSVYLNQSSQYSSRLNLNSPSAYALLGSDTSRLTAQAHDVFFFAGIFFAFCFLAALLTAAWLKRDSIGDRALFLFALAMVIGIPWLLPSMHDRYFYLADVFCVILAVMIPEKWYFAPFCILSSYAGYHAFLFGSYVFWIGLQIPSLIMLFLMGSAAVLLVTELRRAEPA